MAVSTILTFTLTDGAWVLDTGQADYIVKCRLMAQFGNAGRKLHVGENTVVIGELFELSYPHLTLQFTP